MGPFSSKTTTKMNPSETTKQTITTYIRRAHHAGSWYSDDPDELNATLTDYLERAAAATTTKKGETATAGATGAVTIAVAPLRGILCPHAGYAYSGLTAAYSYHALQQELTSTSLSNTSPIRTVVILHPSHHVYLQNCCSVSGASVIQTPIGDLTVDDDLRQEVLSLGHQPEHQEPHFTIMTQSVDEAEHSGEMQYPYLVKVLQTVSSSMTIQVLPIMVGNLNSFHEARYGQLLAPILLSRPDILCIVSTDFCHWGRRFSYQPYKSNDDDDTSTTTTTTLTTMVGNESTKTTTTAVGAIPIHEFISQLDHRGMTHIEQQQPGAFAEYLKQTRNTICGRHAIQVWLHALQSASTTNAANTITTTNTANGSGEPTNHNNNNNNNNEAVTIQFVYYAQSSPPATSWNDSSVSYASAVARKVSSAV
jgi:MEMO1 family protein